MFMKILSDRRTLYSILIVVIVVPYLVPFELPIADVKEHAKWIEKKMTDAIKLDVPLKVDVIYGSTWLSDK